jgi:hypothetical protein
MQSHKPTSSDNLKDENSTRASQEDELYIDMIPSAIRTNDDDDTSSEGSSLTASLYSSRDITGESLAHPRFSSAKQAHLRAELLQPSFDQKVYLKNIDNYTLDEGRPEPQINELIAIIQRYDANTADHITSSQHEVSCAVMNAFQRFSHPVFKYFEVGMNELISKGRTPSPREIRDVSGQVYDAWLDQISFTDQIKSIDKKFHQKNAINAKDLRNWRARQIAALPRNGGPIHYTNPLFSTPDSSNYARGRKQTKTASIPLSEQTSRGLSKRTLLTMTRPEETDHNKKRRLADCGEANLADYCYYCSDSSEYCNCYLDEASSRYCQEHLHEHEGSGTATTRHSEKFWTLYDSPSEQSNYLLEF